MEKREPSCTVGGNVNWYSDYGEQYGDSLKTWNKTIIWPNNPTTGHICQVNHQKDTCTPMFIAVLFTTVRPWKQPLYSSTDEWIKKLWYMYRGIFSQFSSVQSLCHVRLFVTPWIAARQASLSITNSRGSLRLTSMELVMPSSHLLLCHPLLLLPPIPPSISLFQWVNSSHEVAKILEFQL